MPKKDRSFDFYLIEDGPYHQTVIQYADPYINKLPLKPSALDIINRDMKSRKSQLYKDLDKEDKRLKSGFLCAYYAVRDYKSTIPSDKTEESELAGELLTLFEKDMLLNKKELLGECSNLVTDVQKGLLDWSDGDNWSGDDEKALKVLLVTYLSMRTLWVKFTCDPIVSRLVPKSLVRSLEATLQTIREVFSRWYQKIEDQKQIELESQRQALASQGIIPQIETTLGEYCDELTTTTKESIVAEHREKRQRIALLMPLARSIADYRNEAEMHQQIKGSYATSSKVERLAKLLNLSDEDSDALENLCLPEEQGYLAWFQVQSYPTYTGCVRWLKKGYQSLMGEVAPDRQSTLLDKLNGYLKGVIAEDLKKKLDDRVNVMAGLKASLLDLVNKVATFIPQPLPHPDVDENTSVPVTKVLKQRFKDIEKELEQALVMLQEKRDAFECWWGEAQALLTPIDELCDEDRAVVHSLYLAVLNDVYHQLFSEVGDLLSEDNPKLVLINYFDVAHGSITKEKQRLTAMTDVMDISSAKKTLKALTDWIGEHWRLNGFVSIICPTYRICYTTVQQELSNYARNPQAQTPKKVLGTISQQISDSIKQSWRWSITRLALSKLNQQVSSCVLFNSVEPSPAPEGPERRLNRPAEVNIAL